MQLGATGTVAYTCTCFRKVESGRVYRMCRKLHFGGIYWQAARGTYFVLYVLYIYYFGSSALALVADYTSLSTSLCYVLLTLWTAAHCGVPKTTNTYSGDNHCNTKD